MTRKLPSKKHWHLPMALAPNLWLMNEWRRDSDFPSGIPGPRPRGSCWRPPCGGFLGPRLLLLLILCSCEMMLSESLWQLEGPTLRLALSGESD
jgi:hypothetical protein